jgi:hypothetical protein
MSLTMTLDKMIRIVELPKWCHGKLLCEMELLPCREPLHAFVTGAFRLCEKEAGARCGPPLLKYRQRAISLPVFLWGSRVQRDDRRCGVNAYRKAV